jgi:hypothetical protein
MARREAAAHTLPASPATLPHLRAVDCPWCGEQAPPPTDASDRPIVTVLACEWLAPRALLAAAALAKLAGPTTELRFRSRATWLTYAVGVPPDVIEQLDRLESTERWVDDVLAGTVPDTTGQLTLPAVTRRTGSSNDLTTLLAANFLTPHRTSAQVDRLNSRYLETRLRTVAERL